MKGFWRLLALFVLSTVVVQAAERPPSCRFSTLPTSFQRAVEDLSGKLPVADYLDGTLACQDTTLIGLPPPPPPTSPWLEADAKANSELLARAKFDWLILPTQTQYYGFDRIERALIASEIAEIVAPSGSYPDVLLVMRALGEPLRRYPSQEVSRLAGAVAAKKQLEIYAGHDGKQKLTLTLIRKECDANGACKAVKQRDWRALSFSDVRPPFQVIRELRAEIRKEIPGAAGAVPKPVRAVGGAVGFEPRALLSQAAKLDAVSSVALIASLAPADDDLSRERLHLLTLRAALADASAPVNRVLAANAAMNLHRRPYAIELLKGLDDPAAKVQRELLDGDLLSAEKDLAAVKPPLLRFVLALATEDLRQAYGRKSGFDTAAVAALFGSTAPAWQPYLDRRISDANPWGTNDGAALKSWFDLLYPTPGMELATLIRGKSAVGKLDGDVIPLANLRHARNALDKLDARNGSARQVFWLLEGTAKANVFKDLRHDIEVQGAPERALRKTEMFGAIFDGHPEFEHFRYQAAFGLARKSPGDLGQRLQRQGEAAERSYQYFALGQSSFTAQYLLGRQQFIAFYDAYSRDFPRRVYWPVGETFSGFMAREEATREYCLKSAYAISELKEAMECLNRSPEVHKPALRAALSKRFRGHDQFASLIAPLASATDAGNDFAALEKPIADDPQNWNNYLNFASTLILKHRDFERAQKILLSYPEFAAKRPAQPVELSNNANMAAVMFLRIGREDLARPLLEISARLDTGSEESLASQSRLALVEGDYAAAAEISRQRYERYDSAEGFRDYLSILYVTGHSRDATAAIPELTQKSLLDYAWNSILVGQRLEGMTYEKFAQWIQREDVRKSRGYFGRAAPAFALGWVTVDRKPPAGFAELVAKLEADVPYRIATGGTGTSLPHPVDLNGLMTLKPSSLRVGKLPPLPVGTAVKGLNTLLAEAWVAYHAGKYEDASAKFTALADRYPIEEESLRVVLPYFAFAAVRSGDKSGFETWLATQPWGDLNFDVLLSRAMMAAARRDADGAEKSLRTAFLYRMPILVRQVPTEWQYVEALETARRETGDARFDAMIVEWARAQQQVDPLQAWPYALEAAYSKNPTDVTRALAMTLYLDPQSPRIRKFDAQKIAAAKAWLLANNPFLRGKRAEERREVQTRLMYQPSPAS